MSHHITRRTALGVALTAAMGCRARGQQDDTTRPQAPAGGGGTLVGQVLCGYQGWFTCEGDGAGRGWFHWGGHDGFQPGSCSIDLWPDVSELDPDERYDTPFRHADGSVAQVFSSMNPKTVDRHFRWMADHGTGGAFVQRFAGETMHPAGLNHCNTVLASCRAGANRHGRTYAVMYDLSGLGANSMDRVIEDYRALVSGGVLDGASDEDAYLVHRDRPVVAVWGVGFSDGRAYTLEDCARLVRFLKEDPECGGRTVMLGVPSWWRTLERDAVADPYLHEVLALADIVSPWSVGRYGTPQDAEKMAHEVWAGDLEWCAERGLDFLPVVFPGFSWHNMQPNFPLDQIPRLGGEFLWAQYRAAAEIGCTMVYQAMFDEVDEGTAIFKCTNDPPVGESPFLTYEGLPSDHYLWLAGMGAKLIRGEIEATERLPAR